MDYFTTTRIWLSLGDYYKYGMTPDQVKAVIEKVQDQDGSLLHCEQSGDKLTVEVKYDDPEQIRFLVLKIDSKLQAAKIRMTMRRIP